MLSSMALDRVFHIGYLTPASLGKCIDLRDGTAQRGLGLSRAIESSERLVLKEKQTRSGEQSGTKVLTGVSMWLASPRTKGDRARRSEGGSRACSDFVGLRMDSVNSKKQALMEISA